jgi:predicted NBD/HSP70 family sugar kinase
MNLKKGLKKEHLKYSNRSLILKNIFYNGPMSKKNLSDAIRLTPAALTLICNDMIKRGILVEVGEKEQKRAGRKEVLLDINRNYAYVVGIEIKKDSSTIALSNVAGEIIEKSHTENPNYSDDYYFENIKQKVEALLIKNRIKKENVLGIGVSVVGIVNPKRGISVTSHGIWNRDVNIKKKLESKLDFEVVVDNDIRSLAVAHTYINRNFKDIIFLKYGPRIGSAIIRKGELFLGKYYYAGEIGHSILDDGKDYCPICKRRGCLESSINFDKIISKIKEDYLENNSDYPQLSKLIKNNSDNIDMDKILESVANGGIKETKLLQDSAKKLAITLLNSMSMIDPENVILYGKAFDSDKFYDVFQQVIMDFSLNDEFKKMKRSTFKEEDEIFGSIFLAIEKFFYREGL